MVKEKGRGQANSVCQPFVSNTNPFADEHFVGPSTTDFSQNKFEPLFLLDGGETHNISPSLCSEDLLDRIDPSPISILQRQSPNENGRAYESPSSSTAMAAPNPMKSTHERGEPSSPPPADNPTKEELTRSLLACETEEDYRRWIRWMLVPFVGEVGVTTSMGNEGQVKLFIELGKEMEDQIGVTNPPEGTRRFLKTRLSLLMVFAKK
ncbi:hypothetical protein FRX31_026980 [Thalictrum thalictroides]|uniref:Uncharacterized protein n=1 Tax=Thalictrum thalictroides TaxID=46969 RepID=A0A7J6VEX9_THATH|nr:hypothetical protein FRX31_026980 [Thalictrum thalictroides]